MEENEKNVEVEVESPESPVEETESKPSAGAKFKEWCRKRIVALKRQPQIIPLIVLLAASVFLMFAMFPISRAAYSVREQPQCASTGICLFVSSLLSLLVLVSFLNSFPKRKKPNVIFICVVYLMVGAMIGFDLWYYMQIENCIAGLSSDTLKLSAGDGQIFMIVHIILLGIFAVVFALLPVYSRLINKIDTSIKVESATANMQAGQIDIQE